jgi:hypothetical protein
MLHACMDSRFKSYLRGAYWNHAYPDNNFDIRGVSLAWTRRLAPGPDPATAQKSNDSGACCPRNSTRYSAVSLTASYLKISAYRGRLMIELGAPCRTWRSLVTRVSAAGVFLQQELPS